MFTSTPDCKIAVVFNDSDFPKVSDNIFIYGNVRVPILHIIINGFLALQDIIQSGYRVHIMSFYIVEELGLCFGKAVAVAVKAI